MIDLDHIAIKDTGARDGLGERLVGYDHASGESLLLLRVRPELAAFADVLDEAVQRLAGVNERHLLATRGLARPPGETRPLVVSDHMAGDRLSDLLARAQACAVVPDVTVAVYFANWALGALTALERKAGTPHGVLSANRFLVGPRGRIVLADCVFAAAVGRLGFSRRRYWRELGVAMPDHPEPPVCDARADVAQVAVLLVSLVLGRPLDADEFPDHLEALLKEVREVAWIRGGDGLATAIGSWLDIALPLPGRQIFDDAGQAQGALASLLPKKSDYLGSRAEFQAFLKQLAEADEGDVSTTGAVPPGVEARADEPVLIETDPADAVSEDEEVEPALEPPADASATDSTVFESAAADGGAVDEDTPEITIEVESAGADDQEIDEPPLIELSEDVLADLDRYGIVLPAVKAKPKTIGAPTVKPAAATPVESVAEPARPAPPVVEAPAPVLDARLADAPEPPVAEAGIAAAPEPPRVLPAGQELAQEQEGAGAEAVVAGREEGPPPVSRVSEPIATIETEPVEAIAAPEPAPAADVIALEPAVVDAAPPAAPEPVPQAQAETEPAAGGAGPEAPPARGGWFGRMFRRREAARHAEPPRELEPEPAPPLEASAPEPVPERELAPPPLAPALEPEPEPVTAVVSAELEPEPQPVAEVVAPAPVPEPEPVADAKGAEPEPEPAAELVPPGPEPEPGPVAQAVSPERAPEPELVAEAVEPEPEPEPEWVAEAVELEPEPEPVAEVVPSEPTLEPEPVAEVVPAEPALEPEFVAEIVLPEPEPEAEPVAEVVPPEPVLEPEFVAEVVVPEPEPGREPVAEPEPVAEVVLSEPELEPEPVAEVVAAEPEPEPEPVAAVAASAPGPEVATAAPAPAPTPRAERVAVAAEPAPVAEVVAREPEPQPVTVPEAREPEPEPATVPEARGPESEPAPATTTPEAGEPPRKKSKRRRRRKGRDLEVAPAPVEAPADEPPVAPPALSSPVVAEPEAPVAEAAAADSASPPASEIGDAAPAVPAPPPPRAGLIEDTGESVLRAWMAETVQAELAPRHSGARPAEQPVDAGASPLPPTPPPARPVQPAAAPFEPRTTAPVGVPDLQVLAAETAAQSELSARVQTYIKDSMSRTELAEDDRYVFDEPEPPPARGRWLRLVAVIALLAGMGYAGAQWLATRPGTVTLESTPGQSRVLVDGREVGTTPLSVGLPPGEHRIEMRRSGRQEVLTVMVEPGQTISRRVEWPRMPATGSLAVTSEPPGAKVLVDGEEVGVTPLTVSDLVVGTHAIVVQGETGSVAETVRIREDETTNLDALIYSGWIAVFAPVEMQIYESGRLLGKADGTRILVAAGAHEIELVSEEFGYRVTEVVEVEPGEVKALTHDPKGTVSLNATPWAEVFVDGERIGETPLANVPVTIGIREFVFRHPELGEKRITATITLNDVVRLNADMTQR